MPIDHYENFPVASWLLPARLRPAVETIYRWARHADDLADEGDVATEQRLAALRALDDDLHAMARGGAPLQPVSIALVSVIDRHALPLALFHDLLSAFTQDVTVGRYADFAALRDYSRRSADPIGRLMLHLFDAATPANLERADAICTGLQLANFWQDVAIDWAKGRVYMPLDTLAQFGLPAQRIESYVYGTPIDEAWRASMRFETARARMLLRSGATLALDLPGRIGLELRLVVQGGLRILERIDAVRGDVFQHRPTLRRADALAMLVRACGMRRSRLP